MPQYGKITTTAKKNNVASNTAGVQGFESTASVIGMEDNLVECCTAEAEAVTKLAVQTAVGRTQ